MIITPIVNLGSILSDLILNAVAHTYKTDLPNTCSAIRDYVASNADGLIIDAQSAANIMCLPARVSVFFYKAIVVGWRWFIYGFGNSVVSVFVGAVAIVLFFKCMFKFAFMTIGVVADLFFTLLLLPFTALAEATPKAALSGMVGDIFNGFLKIFNTKKLSDQILVFINATIYFVTLSIIIAICAILLASVTNIQDTRIGDVDAASVLLGGALVFYLADKSDKLAQQIGGKIENTFGKQTEQDARNLWSKLKENTTKILKTWAKNK
ncbi:MAG: hypothetical protein MJ158_01450 [Alphaproteobacteria bacterium]|nr:hypothetical protein [Alphaproteobacteria bacterium]